MTRVVDKPSEPNTAEGWPKGLNDREKNDMAFAGLPDGFAVVDLGSVAALQQKLNWTRARARRVMNMCKSGS